MRKCYIPKCISTIEKRFWYIAYNLRTVRRRTKILAPLETLDQGLTFWLRKAKIFNETKHKLTNKDDKVTVIGNVPLSEDEKALLKMSPDFAVFSSMSDELHNVEVLASGVKHRWENLNLEDEVTESNDPEEDARIRNEMEMIEAQSRMVYDPINNELDLGRQRVTDCPGNNRVFLPKPMTAFKEAMVSVRASEWKKVREEYKSENTNIKGEQKSNLNPQQLRGLKYLLKRVKAGEICIIETDKTGKFCVLSVEDYLEAGATHTDRDECVGDDQIRETQRVLNGHCSYMMKIFGAGSNWGQESRHREARINRSHTIPVLRLLFKDHKGWLPGNGPIPTRGICGANSGMNTHLSELVSLILEPLATSIPGSWEIISGDDYSNKVEEYNTDQDNNDTKLVTESIIEDIVRSVIKLKNDDLRLDNVTNSTPETGPLVTADELKPDQCQDLTADPVTTAFDFISFYPNMDACEAAQDAHDAVMISPMQYSNINYMEAVKYIASNMTAKEVKQSNLKRVIPTRANTGGARPRCTGPEAMGPDSNGEELWDCPKVELSDLEKKKIATQTMFNTHLYQFGGKVYHQKVGGPIGLRGTGAIARVVLAMTDNRVKCKLEANNITTLIDARFLDDGRNTLKPIKIGWKWSSKDDKTVYSGDDIDGESNLSRTAKTIGDIVDSCNKTWRTTVETQEDFSDHRLPTLDTTVWMEEGKILHSFYEKPTTRNTVIHRDSALSENTKMASLSMEVIRRMMNTSERASMDERIEVLDRFADKLASSA